MSATQRLDEVFGLPEGSEVYVLNDFKSSAYDAVRLFETLGLNQFRYIPFYPGAKDDGVARPLITFGEYDDQCHYLPRCIEKIIDVGIRTIDISTIVEIMLRLGLPDEKMHQVTAKYVKDLIALTREINHLNHNNESMRREMESVAEFFGKKVLRDVDEETFLKAIPEVRKVTGDRAVVRAIHFYNDSRRAGEIYEAIKADDFDRFLQLIIEGGHSSFEFNQNAYSIKNPQEQGVPLALAISQKVLNGRGAWRLQGGGFAGTIQAFVPLALLETYKNAIDAVFGAGSCHVLSVRNYGAVMVTPDM